jgi:hypothetical protein
MPILCVAGSKGSGKDTLCDYLVANHGFQKIAFADALKCVSLKLIHATWPSLSHLTMEDMYDREAKERVYEDVSFGGRPFSIRWYLQYLGTNVIREHLSKDVWVRSVIDEVGKAFTKDLDPRICISDCRFANEVSLMKRAFGKETKVFTLRLARGSAEPTDECHPSEAQDFSVDQVFVNDGTKNDLVRFGDALVSKLYSSDRS